MASPSPIEPAPPAAPPATPFQRLQSIENIVVECVEIAAAVAECLASVTDIDKLHVSDLCTKFINYIKVGQQLVQAGLQQPPADRNYEANPYHALTRSHLAEEKLAAVLLHLSAAQMTMQNAGLWQPPAAAAAAAAKQAAAAMQEPPRP